MSKFIRDDAQVADFAVFDYNYDAVARFLAFGVTNPNVVQSFFYSIGLGSSPDHISNVPEIWLKLRWHFNMYEEYKIEEVAFDYEPMFDAPDLFAYNRAYFDIFSNTAGDPLYNDIYAQNVVSLNTSEITLIPDKNDTAIRSSIDEYFQVRARKDSITHRMNQRYSWSSKPTINDLQVTPIDTLSASARNPLIEGTIGNYSGADVRLAFGAPELMGWTPTKAIVPGGTWSINTSMQYYGWKTYQYTPINEANGQGTGTGAVRIGTYKFRYKILFRKPDYRAIISLSELDGLSTQSDLDKAVSLLGQRQIPDFSDSSATFVNKRPRTDVEAQADHLKSRFRPSEPPLSLQIPVPHQSQAVPVGSGPVSIPKPG